MIVGFTGTRLGMTKEQKLTVEDLLIFSISLGGENTFFHGDCVGADFDAHQIAHRLGYRVHIYPGKEVGSPLRANCVGTVHRVLPPLERNRVIVDLCELLLVTPRGMAEESRSGTWATIRYARTKDKPIRIVFPDGSEG